MLAGFFRDSRPDLRTPTEFEMKTFLFLFLTMIFLSACAAGPGSSSNETGAAALSLQLPELSPGLSFQTSDGFRLDFTTFALSFSAITMGSDAAEEPFAADFFDEEVVDIIEIEDVPPDEYEEVTLTLAIAGGLSGPSVQKFLQVKNGASGDDVTSSLNGLSALIIAEAVSENGDESCTLRFELQNEGLVTVGNEEGNHVEVTAGEEAEILVAVDPAELFGNVAVAPLCAGGAVVTISGVDNPELAETVADNLLSGPAFQLESTEGHSHSH